MDFARAQLEKYGWKDGDGLGKTKSGISKPVKAKLKFDNSGLGHSITDELINPWWQRVYDSAAKNVKIEKEGDSVKVETQGDDVEITTKRKKKRKGEREESNAYGNFVKKSFLTWEGEKTVKGDGEDSDAEEVRDVKKRTSGIVDMTDEELFKACGGRTAHKGARHGLSMSAKLARVQSQESGVVDSSEPIKKKKKKKKRKHSEIE